MDNFKSMFDLLKVFSNEEICIRHLEKIRWNGNVVSPFDEASKVYKCKNHRYMCKNTNKYFNVKTGTIFENTKIPLQKWFLAIWLITCNKKGISSLQLSRDLGVTQITAWFMLHRIRKCFGYENQNQLHNEVEIDETFVGGRNKNRHSHKKVRNSQGRSFKDKAPVLGMVERGGKLVARTIENTSCEKITPEVVEVVKDAVIYTDEWVGYKNVAKIYGHNFVRHNKGEFVNKYIY